MGLLINNPEPELREYINQLYQEYQKEIEIKSAGPRI